MEQQSQNAAQTSHKNKVDLQLQLQEFEKVSDDNITSN